MKIKILSAMIVVFSFLSWILWVFVYEEIIKTENKKIVKENPKIIEKTKKEVSIVDLENDITKIVKEISDWVVSIIVKKDLTIYRRDPWWFFQSPIWTVKEKVWWWSWFFVRKDWIIITNKHVVDDDEAEYKIITNSWKEYDAIILAKDPINDLAILKIKWLDFEVKSLEIINENENIAIAQFAIAIWNALNEFQNSVAFWVISWKNRVIEAWWYNSLEKISDLLQTDAAINPWNSWWPLVNLDWKVMGINTAIAGWSQWLGFAIHLSQRKIDYMLESIEKYWEIKKPFIGISYMAVDKEVANELWLNIDYWAYIIDREWSIIKWSAADKAWIKPWEIISEINWKKIDFKNDLNTIIQNKIPWDIINLKVVNKTWEQREVEIKLWKY